MLVQYASDLHIELSGNSRWLKHNPLKVAGEILLLAGDIHYLGLEGCEKHPFWDWCADNYERTVVVPGNHEYYGGFDLSQTLIGWSYQIRSNVKYLNNSVEHIGKTDLICSTLWSKIRIENSFAVENGISDFRRIISKGERLDFVAFNHAHERSVSFIKEAVNCSDAETLVILSHHVPTNILVANRFKGSSLNDAFVSEQGNWIADSRIKYWIYGHSHVNIDGKIGDTEFLSNQLGYVNGDMVEASSFANDKVIEI